MQFAIGQNSGNPLCQRTAHYRTASGSDRILDSTSDSMFLRVERLGDAIECVHPVATRSRFCNDSHSIIESQK